MQPPTPNPPPAEAVVPPRPPVTPRPVTPQVRRRSWGEPRVRFWIIACVALLGVATWFVLDQVQSYRSEQRLIQGGVTADALIVAANHDVVPTHKFPPGTPVDLKFTLNGTPELVSGTLAPSSNDDYIVVGGHVLLHVNPDDPAEWTNRSEPESLARRMIAGAVIVPVAIAAAIAAFMLRRRAVQTWRDGLAETFAVVDTYHTALAPRSHTVHCVATSGRDQKIVTVFLPARLPRPLPGEVLWLIHPPGKPAQSIPSAAYEG